MNYFRLRIELVHGQAEVALLKLGVLSGVQDDGENGEENGVLGGEKEVDESGKLAEYFVAFEEPDVYDEPVDADGDDDDCDHNIPHCQQQEQDVGHVLLLCRVDDK